MDLHGPRDTSKLALPEPSRSGQFAALIWLAGPVVLVRTGNTVLDLTNRVIIGHAEPVELRRQLSAPQQSCGQMSVGGNCLPNRRRSEKWRARRGSRRIG